jgi:hypothetical protein
MSEIRTARPISCHTDFTGLAMLIRSTSTLFQRYLPTNSSATKIKNSVMKLTSASLAGEGLPLDSNVSVFAKGVAATHVSTRFATQVLIIFYSYKGFIIAG